MIITSRSTFGILAGFIFIIAVLWAVGLAVFVQTVTKLSVPPADMRTDAIIVLTGGADRINTGLDLLQAGSAQKLLISGVDQRVTLEKIISMWNGRIDDPSCCVFLGHMAQNTKQNAKESQQWAAQMYVHSIRLVTSRFHMPRAINEFHHAMPEIKILPHPVISGEVEKWILLQEYNKTILSLARTAFGGSGI